MDTSGEYRMKKLFTIDDFMVAFMSAMGYGLGYTLAKQAGWSEILCLAACIALGMSLEALVSKIVFSKVVQKKKQNRICTYVIIFLVFLAAQYFAYSKMGVSLLENLREEFASVVGIPILGFIVNMIIRGFRVWKIRKRYGDGSEGFVFDLKREDIEETNAQNQAVRGEYDANLAVKTRTGVFVGYKYKEIVCYLGIPYAKPPVGERRWKAPEPLDPSDGVFQAVNFGASAIQVEHTGSIIRNHRQSEDCLTLNICAGKSKDTGESKDRTPKPVLVLFHSGDFTSGGAVDPLMYGTNYVTKHPDILFVSFNYRLGIFGFIDFKEVPGGEAYPDAINLGLLDQIAALAWIKENISAFGGDPDKITVLGFESGATSICLLAASEQARGLFRKAFVFNGNLGHVYETPDNARALAKELCKETHTSSMQELMQLSTQSLKEAAQRLWRNMCAPTNDGTLIPSDVYAAYEEGKASGIEFILGFPGKEMQVLRSVIGEQNYEDLISAAVAEIENYTDSAASEAVQKYIKSQTAAAGEMEAKTRIAEQWNALGIYRTALKLSRGGNTVHVLLWDEKPLIENLGSGTIDAAAALLGNGDALHMYGSVMDKDLSEILQTLLAKYIKGEALRLYRNEITYVDALDWKAFPKALIVSDGIIKCGPIENRITEVKELLELAKK